MCVWMQVCVCECRHVCVIWISFTGLLYAAICLNLFFYVSFRGKRHRKNKKKSRFFCVCATCGQCSARYLYVCSPNSLQLIATHRNTPQHIATHCNTLQHTATQCNTIQCTAACCWCDALYFYVCMFVRMSVCSYVCMYVFMICVCMNVCMYVCMYVRALLVCLYVRTYVCMYLWFVYVCMYAYMYVCMYVCMYVRGFLVYLLHITTEDTHRYITFKDPTHCILSDYIKTLPSTCMCCIRVLI